MANYIRLIVCTIALTLALAACNSSNNSGSKIGIIVPLEHRAMDEIITGLTDTLPGTVDIKVKNAQNDPNLQRSIIQQMQNQKYAVIVPIGTSTSQMAISMIHDKPIVSLASELTEQDRKKLSPCNVAIVHDQLAPEQIVAFIHTIYPALTQLTLIHSSSDKIFPEVKEFILIAKNFGITVIPKMVTTLPELDATAQSLPNTTQGIMILKDHLIVSGITTLTKVAVARKIPLITSDQGSVQDGGGFALTFPEKDIGIEGAKLINEVLAGKNPCSLPIVEMKNFTVFINAVTMRDSGQSLDPVVAAAKKQHYHFEFTGLKGT